MMMTNLIMTNLIMTNPMITNYMMTNLRITIILHQLLRIQNQLPLAMRRLNAVAKGDHQDREIRLGL